MLAFEDKIPNNRFQFIDRVNGMASLLQTNPDWLMAVMYAESKLKSNAQNTAYPLANGMATGLIQFTPDTAKALGTTVEALKSMSNVDQLYFVHKYFAPYAGKLKSYFDVYMSVFFPAAIGKSDGWVFETSKISRGSVARQNPSIDENKDGTITVAEFKSYLQRTIPAMLKDAIFRAWNFIAEKKKSESQSLQSHS